MSEPQRYRVYDEDEVLPFENGEYVTYADARAWVEREIAEARAEKDEEFLLQARMDYSDGVAQGQRDALAGAVQRVEALPWEVAVSFGPIDCNYSCEEGPCTCSGEMRPEAWRTGPAQVIAAIKGDNDGE